MTPSAERLFELLPAVYRVRDSAENAVLEGLLAVLDAEGRRLEEDVERLYENWFIETCDDWVVPYIGDLLQVRTLVPIKESSFSGRAMVANTVAYRRGKGTAATLEQLARDVSGWPARAVEMFQLLGTTQFLNHLRASCRTPNLRDWNALELLDSPFDSSARTIDVRHIDNRRGKHNVMNIALFLWRLQQYPMERATADQVAPGAYRFGQLGADVPLFTVPQTEKSISHIAAEENVPGALRRGALHGDLEAYRAANLSVAEEARPDSSAFYGPDSSVHVAAGDLAIAPVDVVAADLGEWSRPPAGVAGVASGSLDPFPTVTSASPSLEVTVGELEPRVAVLSGVPATLEEARSMLQESIRSASKAPAFAATVVAIVEGRLVVLPGVMGETIAFGPSATDATTVHELRLDAASASDVRGVLSRDLHDFPALSAEQPAVEATITSQAPQVVSLASVPTTLDEARGALQDALNAAASSPALGDATVTVVDDRLLVLPGVDGLGISFSSTAGDPSTVYELGLWNAVAVDPRLGRLVFAVGAEPDGRVDVSYAYGFSADIGGGPYPRTSSISMLGSPSWDRKVSQTDPHADFTTIGEAIAAWAAPGDGARGDGKVTVTDNGTYEEELSIPRPAGDAVLSIVAEDEQRPVLRLSRVDGVPGDIVITKVGEPGGTVVLNGLIVAGGVRVKPGSIEHLHVEHCTLVPGRELNTDGSPAWPGSPSLVAGEGNERLEIAIDRTISGPLSVHEEVKKLAITDSIVDSPDIEHVPVLMSGNLSPFPAFSSATPTVEVAIGEREPVTVTLDRPPSSIGDARALLQAAIRNAHWSRAYSDASVTIAGNRLVVVPGAREAIEISPAGLDPTAAELRFDDPAERSPIATVSGKLDTFTGLSSAAPALAAVAGRRTRRLELTVSPTSIPQARAQLQKAIRSSSTRPVFARARVARLGQRLLVIPGVDRTAIDFHAVEDDKTTVAELKLPGIRPALSYTDDGREPGPRTSLERVTVFGSVRVRELALASESIFTEPLVAVRRQLGCVRFSYVPPGSLAPRRYRCQPNGKLVRPLFTSTSYGSPAYAQLATSCPTEISAGAEAEGEMGAFNVLQQNHRIKNLDASLSEYLRFGLEAGIFLAT